MKKLFSLIWGKPQKDDSASRRAEPMDAESVAQVEHYAERVLATLRRDEPTATYDGDSVARLAKDLSDNGVHYQGEQRVLIANMYGAFLGQAILATYPQFPGRWVRWKGDVGIECAPGNGQVSKIMFPINKAFKHIENGEEDSIYALFAAIPEFMQSKLPV